LKNLGAYITFFAFGDCHVTLAKRGVSSSQGAITSQVLLSVGGTQALIRARHTTS
jgi:hypothetical protein